jgi:hypothetical protein
MMQQLPEELVSSLNDLGFGLAEVEEPYTFLRFMLGGDLRLLIQAAGTHRWRVGLASHASDKSGRLTNPILAVPLGQYGPSADGVTLELSSTDLTDELIRVLAECILPVWDQAVGEG